MPTNRPVFVSLKDLYAKAIKANRLDVINSAFLDFKCKQDIEIEEFLHTKAIDFLNRGLCSIYLIIDGDALKQHRLKIEAFFTLSHKVLEVNNKISKSQIKKIAGFKDRKTLHFVLIGQLGKYITNERRSYVSSRLILNTAFKIIRSSSDLIPCRCVMVECKDITKLKTIYEDYGFKFFQKDEGFQYIKLLDKE